MQRRLIILGAIFGFLSVALGAFGAHGLRDILEANGRIDTYHTGINYMMIHALAILVTAWLSEKYPQQPTQWAGYSFAVGIVLFSGSLLLLSIFDLGFMGAIAPIGGVALLAGWALIGFFGWRSK